MLKTAKLLRRGDVFEHNGRTEVAIDDYHDGLIWVSSPERYKAALQNPYYTNACILQINGETMLEVGRIPTSAECEESKNDMEV